MNKRVLYVGSFPPPYGGVTIKNELICNFLGQDYRIVTSKKKGILSLLYFFVQSFFCKKIIFGIGSNEKLFKIVKLFSLFHPNKIRQLIIVVMGGSFSDELVKKPKTLIKFKKVKAILVETKAMKNKLVERGFDNVYLFPNCRQSPTCALDICINSKLKCLFFSKINKEKGAKLVLDLAKIHTDVSFDFWGEIELSFKEEFEASINNLKNCKYCGIFSNHKDLYIFLNQYDLLLFPSTWKHEGVSGALIEAKISGLPAIASNWKYNSDIVNDFKDGLIVTTNDLAGFSDALLKIKHDNELLKSLKEQALLRGREYYIESYKWLFTKIIGG